ncbi:MAG: hypothetical protein HUU34_08015 [Saprospiraceae bacterium]|jgi:hypothetical protein|nr:hypothetical protein [Saprospiraceae bacterium]
MKDEINQLIAKGKLEDALNRLGAAARSLSAHEAADAVTVLEARLADNRQKAILDTHDPDEISRERNSISVAALQILKNLPDEPLAQAPPAKGLTEQAMKAHIMALTFVVKIGVLLWLFNHWQSGGFSEDQFYGTLTLLIPVLAAYGAVMFQDFLDHRHHQLSAPQAQPRIRRSVQWTIYGVILGYGVALCIAIGAKAQGSIASYAGFSGLLAIIESGLGIYLSRIVRTFFPEKNKN